MRQEIIENKCQFCGEKIISKTWSEFDPKDKDFRVKMDVADHELNCDKNPKKKALLCPYCNFNALSNYRYHSEKSQWSLLQRHVAKCPKNPENRKSIHLCPVCGKDMGKRINFCSGDCWDKYNKEHHVDEIQAAIMIVDTLRSSFNIGNEIGFVCHYFLTVTTIQKYNCIAWKGEQFFAGLMAFLNINSIKLRSTDDFIPLFGRSSSATGVMNHKECPDACEYKGNCQAWGGYAFNTNELAVHAARLIDYLNGAEITGKEYKTQETMLQEELKIKRDIEALKQDWRQKNAVKNLEIANERIKTLEAKVSELGGKGFSREVWVERFGDPECRNYCNPKMCGKTICQTRFYNSDEWKLLRAKLVIENDAKNGGRCPHCMRDRWNYPPKKAHHISGGPRFNPQIALDERNVRMWCKECHLSWHD